MSKHKNQLAGLIIGWLCLLGVQQVNAQITPQFNQPVQVSIGQVYLNWPAFPAAVSYQIYWATSPGVDLTSNLISIPSASTLGYNHTGLTGGLTYYYAIRAFDNLGNWTLLSNEVAVTVPLEPTEWYGGGNGDGHSASLMCNSLLDGTPSIPTFDNVFIYTSAEHNRIAWIQYPGASSYLVELSSSAGGPWTTLANTTDLFFNHSNLVGHDVHYYRVTPQGAAGCSVNPSAAIMATVIPNNDVQPGGNGDGHAQALLCTSTLDGVSTPPPTPDFVVYEGIQELFIFWTPVSGAVDYDLEFSTVSASGPWLTVTTNFSGTNFTHTNLVAGQTYYYRLRANLNTGCPIDWSNTFSGVPKLLIDNAGVGIGGGNGDGHAAQKTCPIFLDGTANAPNSQDIFVYMSTESNYIAWPQQSGAADYSVQVATSPTGPWSLLATTTSFAFTHTPPDMVVTTQYFYRVTANLAGGCPLNPSTPMASFALPTYNNLNTLGGDGDGHMAFRTCPMFLNGVFDSPNSQDITVYSSMEQNMIAWPQQTGASDYLVEIATSALGPWNNLTTTSALSFLHQPTSLVVGTEYFYRVTANLSGGCPLNASVPVGGIGVPQYAYYGGGEGDGHAQESTCPILLDGVPAQALSPTPVAYASQDFVYITWPQVAGANAYLLEVSTDGGASWTTLSNSSALFFAHTLQGGAQQTYRLTALLSTGCPLLESDVNVVTPAPSYAYYNGGDGDGHANNRSCTFVTLDQTTVYVFGATTFCDGDSVMLQSSQAVLYEWFLDGIPIPNATNDTYFATQSGVYTVETFNIFSCGASSLDVEVIVHDLPPAPAAPISDPSGLSCGPVLLSAAAAPTTHEYFWQGTNPNGMSTALPGDQPYLATTSGTYYLRSFSTDNCWSDLLTSSVVSIVDVPTEISIQTYTNFCDIGTYDAWNYLVDPDGKAIAAIQNGGNAMENVSGTVFVSNQVSNMFDGNNEFLGRHYVINPDTQPLSPVTVRLYFSQAELDNLIAQSALSSSAFDNVTSIADLVVTKYQGPTEDGIFDLSDATDVQLIYPDSYGADLNGLYIEFDVNGFSEFWIHGADVPLPIELVSFIGACNGGKNSIQWTTASESNTSHYIIESSRDGFVWTKIAEMPAAGTTNYSSFYAFDDFNSGVLTYYRLKQFDIDGQMELYGPISVNCEIESSWMNVYPNPTNQNFTLMIQSSKFFADARIELLDISGRIIMFDVMDILPGTTLLSYDADRIGAGNYIIRIVNYNDSFSPIRLVKF